MLTDTDNGIIGAYRAGGATQVADKPAPKEDMLARVLKDFKSSWEYCAGSWHSRWNDNNDLYNNNRIKKGYEGISNTFVPIPFSTVETLTSALFGTDPKVMYKPPHEKAEQSTDILNSLYDFYARKDQWSLKNINTGRSMFKLGIGIDYYYWDIDHPVKINLPVRDFFFDTTASTIETMRFMGRRYLTTIDDLRSFEVVDPQTGDMKKKYTNLDKSVGGSTGENTDKQEKDMHYGSTVAEPEKHQVEVIEWWTEDKTVSVMNRSVVIEDCENYFKAKARANGEKFPEGIMPFNAARDYVDESLFLSKGELDFISDQCEMLNDLTNQNIDSITFTLNQMYTLDPKYAHLLSEIENLPGAVYPVEANSLQPIQQRSIPPDAFNERQNIKNEIRETTATNEVIKGVGEQGGGSTTATEINAQIAGAGQRIGLKVTQIENEYFHREARIVLELVKLYVTEPMMVEVLGKDGARWEEFDPSEYNGNYEPQVQLEISIENKKREQAMEAKELLGAFLGDPDVNQQELKKMVLQRAFQLDPDEVQMLVQPLDPMMGDPSMMGMDPMMQEPLPPQQPQPPGYLSALTQSQPEMTEQMPQEMLV